MISSRFSLLLLTALALLLPHGVYAQLEMNLSRKTVNWPYVRVYFKAELNNNVLTNLDAGNFRVYENGLEIDSFRVWCSYDRQPVSVGLVWEEVTSGHYVRDIAQTFIDTLDVPPDEVSGMFFGIAVEATYGKNPYLLFPLSKDYDFIKQQLLSITDTWSSPANKSRVYDALYETLQHLVLNGENENKALLIHTSIDDVYDPWRHLQDIRRLARSSNVHIYSLDTYHISPIRRLDTLAQLTGGKYYRLIGPGSGAPYSWEPAWMEIAEIIKHGFQECWIEYKSHCADGTKRDVRVEFSYP